MIKLEYYDKYTIYYNYNGLLIQGLLKNTDVFNFYFPVSNNNLTFKKNFSYIIYNYEVLLFGEKLKNIVDTKIRKEIEEELEEKMKDKLNQEILIKMLFENQLEFV